MNEPCQRDQWFVKRFIEDFERDLIFRYASLCVRMEGKRAMRMAKMARLRGARLP